MEAKHVIIHCNPKMVFRYECPPWLGASWWHMVSQLNHQRIAFRAISNM